MGLRRNVSLLLEAGHPEARQYPLPMLASEAQMVAERQDHMEATRGILVQSAVNSVLSKKAAKNFNKLVEGMMGNG